MNQFLTFVVNHWALWLALVVILAVIAGLELQAKLRGIPTLSPNQVTDLVNHSDAKIFDLREEVLFQQGHITDAVHIPLTQLKDAAVRYKNYFNQPVVVVDQMGQQTLDAALDLRKQGFLQVSILKGGINAWTQAGLPLVQK